VSALAISIVLGVVGYATADIVTYNGAGIPREASGSVTVRASVNPKITLTVDTPNAGQEVDCGAVDPGTTTGGKTVALSVDSNKSFDLTSTQDTTSFDSIALTRTLGNSTGNAKGANSTFSDDYAIDVPWTTEPGNYTAGVVYTVVQN
jgi:hypothetical protein